MTERRVHLSDSTAATSGGSLLPNGTLWSHAVTPGTYVKGGEFTIGENELSSFVKNFSHGYPSKVPVDYEHGTTNGSTLDGLAIPKAGDVVEMHAVFSDADITPEIQAAIDRTKDEWTSLGYARDLDPTGLWVRWRPTPKAFGMLKNREYTEMSIAFDMNYAHNSTGEGQGPTIKAIALTNRPFVDSMASIAASADTITGQPARKSEQRAMKFFTALSAARGKPVTTEDEAVTELTALSQRATSAETELAAANSFRDVIAAEFGGEKDPTKLVATIRGLHTTVTNLTNEANGSKEKETATAVELCLRGHEKKLTEPMKKMFAAQLAANLKAGQKLGETDTEKVLGSMPVIPQLAGQSSGGDDGKSLTNDVAIRARAKELANDPEIKAMRDPNQRQLAAMSRAKREFEEKQNGTK